MSSAPESTGPERGAIVALVTARDDLSPPAASVPAVAEPRGGHPPLPAVDPARAAIRVEDITPEILAGFLTDGDEAVARWALGVALRDLPRARVYEALVREAMSIIGERWRIGRWTISEEHLATQTISRALTAVAPPDEPADRVAPLAVLASVEGERHAIGLTLLEHLLREDGWAAANLGPDVPPTDLVRFVARSEARLVCLSASSVDRLSAVRGTVYTLRALPMPPVVMVGGRIATLVDISDVADWGGDSLEDARSFAREVLARSAEDDAG